MTNSLAKRLTFRIMAVARQPAARLPSVVQYIGMVLPIRMVATMQLQVFPILHTSTQHPNA